MRYPDSDEVPPIWEVGDVILDLYEVKQIFTGGGMGLVYRVHHRGWNMDLAVKSPRPEFFQSQSQIENFEREAETWVNLGLHPCTVSCYYVRRLGGIPRLFAEFIDGGSLADSIRSRALYKGGPDQALERILDIAIQSAWGLQHAHEQSLIHQDIKPSNILMSAGGLVKVTDFGIAQIQSFGSFALFVNRLIPGWDTGMQVTRRGMTPAYCSPEQAEIAAQSRGGVAQTELPRLTRRTDIWSWAISVLEMFMGEPPCPMGGQAAAHVFEEYLDGQCNETPVPKMPEGLVEVLRHCFQRNPADRPQEPAEAAASLTDVYQQVIGSKYPRQAPKALEVVADGLNNRALSLLDLGKQEEAEKLFDEALRRHPEHAEAIYNRGIMLWRSGRETDDNLIAQLEILRKAKPNDWKSAYVIGLVHLERTDKEGAVQALEVAKDFGGKAEVIAALAKAHAMRPSESSKFLRIFEGHRTWVNSVCLSSDSSLALSGSCDHTLRLWDVTTGRELRVFEGHKNWVTSVCLSSDNRLALSGSIDETVRIWDVATGKCLHILQGHKVEVNCVCISSNNRWALSAGGDENPNLTGMATLRLWDVTTGRCRLALTTLVENTVDSVSLSADMGKALSSEDNTPMLVDLLTGKNLRTFAGHTGRVKSVCLSNGHAISGSDDKTIRLWDVFTGRCLRVFEGHKEAVYSVALSSDNRRVLSGSYDHTLRIWDADTGQCLRTFEGHRNGVYSVALSSDGQLALSGSWDKTLRLWDIGGLTHNGRREKPSFLLCHAVTVGGAADAKLRFDQSIAAGTSALSVERWGKMLEHVAEARSIRGYETDVEALKLWNAAGLHCFRPRFRAGWGLRTFKGHTKGVTSGGRHTKGVTSVRLSSDNLWALSGSGDGTLRLWDVASGQCQRIFEGHAGEVSSICLSSGDQYVVSAGQDKTMRLWNVSTGECTRTFENDSSNCIALSADSRWVFSGGRYRTVRMWDAVTGNCIRNFKGHTHSVSSIYLSSDNCQILTGSWDFGGGLLKTGDMALRLWDVAAGKCLRTFIGHTATVGAVCLSSDNRWALSGSGDFLGAKDSLCHDDCSLRLWNVATGQCARIFEGHESHVMSVHLTSDARWAVSGSHDKTVRLWNIATGQCERIFEGHTSSVNSVYFSPDGRFIVSGSDDGTVRLWELDWDFEAREPVDWDEGARFVLTNFLTLHTPYASEVPTDRQPTDDDITRALTRSGTPSWEENDFKELLHTLACAGYGWLKPEGVRKELMNMAATWNNFAHRSL